MTFKYYDLLTHLVPGIIVLGTIQFGLGISYDALSPVPALALSYIVGYIINALGSWLENIYFITWGGKPSTKLLDGIGTRKVKFFEADKIKQFLKNQSGKSSPSSEELFGIAMRLTIDESKSRIDDFNASYGFSRTILTSGLVCTIILLKTLPYDLLEYGAILLIDLVLWQRCKERGYYFSREILNACLNVIK